MAIGPVEAQSLTLSRPDLGTEVGSITRLREASPTEVSEGQSVSFGDVFSQLVASANERGHSAHAAAVALAEGRSDDIHGAMIEGQMAGIQTRLVATAKNKVVDAFYELWRMNV